MSDSDSRVRYYACESLYNVTKVTRDNIITVFNEIFVSMTSVITDLVNLEERTNSCKTTILFCQEALTPITNYAT